MKWQVTVIVERDDLTEIDDVQFGLPWTDVVGPEGDIQVGEPEELT